MAKKAKSTSAKRTAKSIKKSADWDFKWPQERDVMLRPERLKYVRKMIKFEGCVFCQARDQGVNSESLCVYKNKTAMAILNKFPYNSGHIMVLPTRHCGDLTELTEQEHLDVQKLLKHVVKIIKDEYNVDGLNIGLNMGHVAGAGLPDHLHWHLIPRWSGDTNFFPLIAETKVVPENLGQTYSRYAKHFVGV